MKNEFEKSKKINVEISDLTEKVQEHIQEVGRDIDESLSTLRYFLQTLERDAYEIQMMNKTNAQIEKSPEWADQAGLKLHTQVDYDEVRKHIADTEKTIRTLKDLISSDLLFKAIFQTQLEELTTLETKFKKELVKLNPERFQ